MHPGMEISFCGTGRAPVPGKYHETLTVISLNIIAIFEIGYCYRLATVFFIIIILLSMTLSFLKDSSSFVTPLNTRKLPFSLDSLTTNFLLRRYIDTKKKKN